MRRIFTCFKKRKSHLKVVISGGTEEERKELAKQFRTDFRKVNQRKSQSQERISYDIIF